jgi:alkylation response protein AidB-like acyl-CoA dehydrogenase
MPYPEEYGGSSASAVATCLALESFGRAGVDTGLTLSWSAHMILAGIPIWKFGTEEQKQRYLPGMSSGELIGCFCLTEPNAGSDATGMKTRAERKGDRWVLNGSKTFITNAPVGDVFIVTAVTDPKAKAQGISAFLVDGKAPGLSTGTPFHKLGHRSSPTSEVFFEDCEIPADALLGPEGGGFTAVGHTILGWERSCLLAPCVGGIGACLDLGAAYSMERHQFKRPIGEFQAMQHKLADMRVAYEVGRYMVLKVAWHLDRGEVPMRDAAMAKLFVSERLVRSAEDLVQIFGGYGYIKEYAPERIYRDAKLSTIGAGTSEIQKSIIARSLMRVS